MTANSALFPLPTPEQACSMAASAIERCRALARISADPGGIERLYLTAEHKKANAETAEWMRSAGMGARQDGAGNIRGTFHSAAPYAKTLIIGSHLDTVRAAGMFDGALGVTAGIEIVSWLHRHNVRLPFSVEVIGFNNEEGVRFPVSMIGSNAVAGVWDEAWLDARDENGVVLRHAFSEFGLVPQHPKDAALDRAICLGYLELHIEQGPVLEQTNAPLGVVSAITAYRIGTCRFSGKAGHAGTVPMNQRQDAVAGAAEWIHTVEKSAAALDNVVATNGIVRSMPGAANVIPGEAVVSLDSRCPDTEQLNAFHGGMLKKAAAIAAKRGLSLYYEEDHAVAATPCDARLTTILRESVCETQGRAVSLPSGAGHDAQMMAQLCPVGMLFVRCKDGVSHHPDESVTTEDVAAALSALLLTVEKLAKQKNSAS